MLFRKPQKDFCIYLTFDDGPSPEVTEWVLETLKKENIKATFFCLGKQVEARRQVRVFGLLLTGLFRGTPRKSIPLKGL